MSFFLLKIDPNYKQKSDLFNMLGHTPNGNVLGGSRNISSPSLHGCNRVYWLDVWSITEININHVRSINGILSFEKLDVPVTIYDSAWRYEDDYIDRLFLPYV